ncbi:hypothetical protein GF325_01265 [Candidatus Bathyarchaeota archaeon]|nr:hypothetical protein [Candidatus Bathyarchaeota archaeon]
MSYAILFLVLGESSSSITLLVYVTLHGVIAVVLLTVDLLKVDIMTIIFFIMGKAGFSLVFREEATSFSLV